MSGNNKNFSWLANKMDDIKKLTMSIIFIAGLGYAGLDFVATKFVTKIEAQNYALQSNVATLDNRLANTQIFVLENELYRARRDGIVQEDKQYLRTLHKRTFVLKIKLKLIDAKESDYQTPSYLRE